MQKLKESKSQQQQVKKIDPLINLSNDFIMAINSTTHSATFFKISVENVLAHQRIQSCILEIYFEKAKNMDINVCNSHRLNILNLWNPAKQIPFVKLCREKNFTFLKLLICKSKHLHNTIYLDFCAVFLTFLFSSDGSQAFVSQNFHN
ncbi:hypothetical protein Bhyg_10359 [Pseudolycoriella hygida]|uniref:Uncharacterized protein n=1 Tax=Pseudolycoriella hygida TaxID=35572 RepID=A0A9Q0MTD3_9DIPT|nr:hypothetical protein Bhyg_10359 [Pseudolycoriella hygida]